MRRKRGDGIEEEYWEEEQNRRIEDEKSIV
jgi:hypothetical protein